MSKENSVTSSGTVRNDCLNNRDLLLTQDKFRSFHTQPGFGFALTKHVTQ